MTRTTANFVLAAKRISITLDTTRGYIGFQGVGGDGGAGQVRDDIAKLYNSTADAFSSDLDNVLGIWLERHLQPIDPYNAQQEDDIKIARDSLKRLDGVRLPEPIEGYKVDEIEEAEFNNNSDIIDSRDIIARIEYLNEALADLPDDVSEENYDPDEDANGNRNDAIRERQMLRDLESQAADYAPDWQYGATLINESYFVEAMEEQTKEIGDLPKDMPSYLVINWEATAENLKVDYTEVTFDGTTFFVR